MNKSNQSSFYTLTLQYRNTIIQNQRDGCDGNNIINGHEESQCCWKLYVKWKCNSCTIVDILMICYSNCD